MKSFKGTQGEWHRHGTIIKVKGGGFDIRYMPDAEENAKLIVMSPKLLSSLQKLVEVYDSDTGKQYTTATKREAIEAARAAIYLALGD